MVKKIKKKPLLIFFVSVLTFLSTLFLSTNVAYADGKELTGVVTDISVLNMSDSKLEPNADGTYQIITNRSNQFFVQFDLKQYDGKLTNGDYFDVDIPTPVTVYNGTTELYDKETKVNIGTVVVTANGDNQGGKARVTLKNLDEFQAKTGGDIVKGVKGNYAITFLFKSDQTATPITFENKGVGKTITHSFTSKTVDSKQEGFENYAKVGNDVVSKEWTSAKLAAIGSVGKGDVYSPWRIRVNTGKQDYGKNLVLNDFLPNTSEFAPIQYIPESLVVYSSATLNDGTSQVPSDAKKMVEGTDYTVAWNENYTQFNLIFADGSKSYWVEYHTTTPGDGRKVQNVIQLTTADGTALTQRSNRTNLDFKAERVSLVKGQIEASTAFKIKINKTNAFTLVPVAGAVYTVKSEDGTISTELTTNEKGVAISDEFDQKYVGKTFIIKEKTAPAGYTLDEKEYKVVLGAEGSKINLQDEPIAADFSITAKKVIAGNRPVALKDGEFKFDLYNANNLTTPIASTTNKADGSITFEGLKAKGPGTYNYVIKENTETKVPGITFDENSYEVTVVVKAEGGTLKAEVTTQTPTLTNTYEPSPARATFKATKELVGKELAKEQFEFELSEGGKVIATSSNGKTVNGVEAATNEVVFSVLYTEAGDHEYTITEKAGSEEGVTYSTESYTIHVSVVDNGEGKLVATVKEADAARKFTNTYKATPAEAVIKATKELVGKELAKEQFEFELSEGGNVIATSSNGKEVEGVEVATNEVAFKLSYTEAGEHEYVLTEKAGSVAGVEYSTESHTIHVSVADNGEGKLVATVKEADSTRKFTNKYKVSPTEAVIKATKELVGKELAKEQFEFELSEGGNVIATSSNGKEVEGVEVATNEVAFKLSYTEAGEHEYVLTEKAGSVAGVEYSTESHTIHVSVVDNGEGKLVATVKEEDSTRKFTNKYKATPAEAVIKATKELVGKELTKEQFEFELSEGGNVIATSSNGKEVEGVEVATNEVAFKLSYTEAGEHEYVLTEKAGSEEGVTYSTESYTIHVSVVDNGEGKLVATVQEANAARKFTNTYVTTTTTTTTTTTESTTTTTTTTTSEEPTTTTTTTTTSEESTTTSTTTTSEEPSTTSTTTTTTSEEPSTTSTTTTTTSEEPSTTSTTTTTTSEEPSTTSTTTTTTSEEPSTTSTTTTTTSEEPSTTSTTTTTTSEEPSTTSTTTTTTSEEPSTTSTTTTTTEEPVVTETTVTPENQNDKETTTTPEPTTPPTPYVPNDGPTTTPEPTTPPTPYVPNDGPTSTTTEETSETTEETTSGTTVATSEKPAPSVTTTEDKPGLPFTGEATGATLVLAGVVILSGTVVMKRKFSK